MRTTPGFSAWIVAPVLIAIFGLILLPINRPLAENRMAARARQVAARSSGLIVKRIAGAGRFGFAGDGGAATVAAFDLSDGALAFDPAGNLLLADKFNNRVRSIETATGNISTVAGNGDFEFSGDGGPATAAGLLLPVGLAFDSAGNYYIADEEGHNVRKVDAATGNISTVAGDGDDGFSGDGGAATSASLNAPTGVAVDSAGNIYIADKGNHRIRKVDAASGIISTLAGNGEQGFSGDGATATAATLDTPLRVTVDVGNNVYIADSNNHVIRKVAAASGLISSVAGIGVAGFSGDGTAATSAMLNLPSDVVLDASGNIYIADRNNGRVRRVDSATGTITSFAGGGTLQDPEGASCASLLLIQPSALALDASGNIHVADTQLNRVFRIQAGAVTHAGDTDLDGFSNDLETTAGSLANDAGNTPFGGASVISSNSIEYERVTLKFNTRSPGQDLLKIKGVIFSEGNEELSLEEQTFIIDAGGVLQSIRTDANGKFKGDQTKLFKARVIGSGDVKFTATFIGDFSGALADEGFSSSITTKEELSVVILFLYNNTAYADAALLNFGNNQGSGKSVGSGGIGIGR